MPDYPDGTTGQIPRVGDLTRTLEGVQQGLRALGEALERGGFGSAEVATLTDRIKAGVCIVLVCPMMERCEGRPIELTVIELLEVLERYVGACRAFAAGFPQDLPLPPPVSAGG